MYVVTGEKDDVNIPYYSYQTLTIKSPSIKKHVDSIFPGQGLLRPLMTEVYV